MTDSEIVLSAIRQHITPHCRTQRGRLPSEDQFAVWLRDVKGEDEWTLDAFGARDWKVDHSVRLGFSVRYRGDDPIAHRAARACNHDLPSPKL